MEDVKKIGLIVLIIVLAGLAVSGLVPVRATDCSAGDLSLYDIGICISKLNSEKSSLDAANATNKAQLTKLQDSIKSIQANINAAAAQEKKLEADVADRERKLAEQYVVFTKKTRELYKTLRSQTPLVEILSSVGSGELNRERAYKQEASDQDRRLIIGLADEIAGLENDKKDVEDRKIKLASLQTALDKNADFLKGEVAKADQYGEVLSSQIASLSALQQSILSGKGDTFQTTVGDVPLADDPNSRPDFDPGFRPAFAAFSFGAPHFKGMSQYGALGRAKANQSVEQILKAYYGDGVQIRTDYPTGTQIKVSGYGLIDIESYTKRIYEMPASWGDEGGMAALKAQAVAARSYALAYTDEGRGSTICTTEACQVFQSNEKGGHWNEAVDATRGWVLWVNGKPLSAWYASTSGGYQESYTTNGYSTPGFWDAVGGRGGWTSQAYEKTAGSPWFYKGWYKDRSGQTCGRSHPWLTSEEMADIVNAWVVRHQGVGDSSRVVPIDVKSCWGKDASPYSMDELRGLGGYTSVSGISVSYSDGGYTASVTLTTNKGDVTIDGGDFKEAFNLRAPGKISLKSGLFNIEKK